MGRMLSRSHSSANLASLVSTLAVLSSSDIGTRKPRAVLGRLESRPDLVFVFQVSRYMMQ